MSHPHHDHAGHGRAPDREPRREARDARRRIAPASLLRASAATRLAGAGVAIAAVWAGVFWAIA